ncbi:hypothetical protein [Algoriphagus aquimarinus]|uniref:hypothetical protein n=1 Tax=Algoriphagus aquimarinus TaxID=237018 RepID=UPI0030D805F2
MGQEGNGIKSAAKQAALCRPFCPPFLKVKLYRPYIRCAFLPLILKNNSGIILPFSHCSPSVSGAKTVLVKDFNPCKRAKKLIGFSKHLPKQNPAVTPGLE